MTTVVLPWQLRQNQVLRWVNQTIWTWRELSPQYSSVKFYTNTDNTQSHAERTMLPGRQLCVLIVVQLPSGSSTLTNELVVESVCVTRFASLFTSAYMELRHPIWHCALRLLPALVAVISVQHHMAICWCLEREQSLMNHAVRSLWTVCLEWHATDHHPVGTLRQFQSTTQDNTVLFSSRDMIWRFRHCLDR